MQVGSTRVNTSYASKPLGLVIQVSLGAGAKDELHVVEAEALDYEGKQITATVASLKMSVQPTVRFINSLLLSLVR